MRAQSVSAGACAPARGRRRSRPAARTGRARRPSCSARSSAARPRRMSSWSQRARSWSSSRIGSPAGPTRARRPRRLDLHQRDEAVHLRLRRGELGQDAAEAQRVLAQRGPHPVVAGGRRVALVEDEVDRPRAPTTGGRRARRRAAPRTGRAPRRASAWRGRCAARRSARGRGTRARSRRSSGRRAGAA